jgi:hypothetical protein
MNKNQNTKLFLSDKVSIEKPVYTTKEIVHLKQELQDLLAIYLECDLAGDNTDRRSKLAAVADIHKILDNL